MFLLKKPCSELAVLGLGANKAFEKEDDLILSPKETILEAVECLEKELSSFRLSSCYVTAPMYYENQSPFYNGVCCGYYNGSPRSLLRFIHSVEKKFGRNRKNEERNGPRTLDIDIELFGNRVLATKHLVIPHERIKERAFVLKPLLEILPDCADVHTGRPYREFLENLGTLDGVVYSVENWR